jgi:hypothetical protein
MASVIRSLAMVALCGASLAGCSAHIISPTSSTLPVLTSLQPAQGAVGTSISIHGGLIGATSVQFGASQYAPTSVASDTIVTFVAPRTSNPCGLSATPCCAGTAVLITADVYNLTVTTAGGTSNALPFTVTP